MVSYKIMLNSLMVWLVLNVVFIFGSCGEIDNGLPQMYQMENFTKCGEEGGLWCLYNYKISAKDTSSRIWKEIEQFFFAWRCCKTININTNKCLSLFEHKKNSSNAHIYCYFHGSKVKRLLVNSRHNLIIYKVSKHVIEVTAGLKDNANESKHDRSKLDRSYLHRMICLPRNQQDRSSYVKKVMEKELYGKNLTFDILNYDCDQDVADPLFITLVGLLITSYIAFVVQATWWHYKHLNDPKWPKTSYQKWCDIFSIIKNYQKLTQNNTNADFQRLKGVQGIRVIVTGLVIMFHSVFSLFAIYVDDVDQLEKIYKNPFIFYLSSYGAFIVQPFFAISAALLTNKILEVHRKHGEFTLKHCFILVLHRYFRFAPTLLILTTIPKLGMFKNSPHAIKPVNIGVQSCTRYGWYTLFQVNFLVPKMVDICLPPLWYLSVDTLYYITTVAVLYIALKFHLDIKKISTVMFIGFCLAYGNYLHKLTENDLWYNEYPQRAKAVDDSEFLKKVYINPLASWSTSCMGIILGYIYFRYKNRTQIKISSKLHTLWLLTVICVPLLIIHAATKSYEGVMKTILAATIKPMFIMITCLLILGMAFGLGGALKKILESKFMVIMSNTTYCTYVFHIIITYTKGVFTFGLLHVDIKYMIQWVIFELVTSFAIGTACTILFEYPGMTLQNKYLPQIKKPIKIEVNKNDKK